MQRHCFPALPGDGRTVIAALPVVDSHSYVVAESVLFQASMAVFVNRRTVVGVGLFVVPIFETHVISVHLLATRRLVSEGHSVTTSTSESTAFT